MDNDETELLLSKTTDSDVYNFLTRYYLHQDQLSWSRTQTIVGVEAAVLAGAFARGGLLAFGVLILGASIIWLIWRLINRDWQVRDQDLDLLDNVHKPRMIRLTRPAIPAWGTGKRILSILVWLVVTVDLASAAWFLFGALCNCAPKVG